MNWLLNLSDATAPSIHVRNPMGETSAKMISAWTGSTSLRTFVIATLCLLFTGAVETAAATVAFNRDVQPILSDNCFHCHGPDKAQRKAGLRLDTEEGAFATLESGGHAIVKGDISASELIRRIT